jgi:hypothetical protein
LVEVFSERSIEDAFNDEAHRNLLIDGIEVNHPRLKAEA